MGRLFDNSGEQGTLFNTELQDQVIPSLLRGESPRQALDDAQRISFQRQFERSIAEQQDRDAEEALLRQHRINPSSLLYNPETHVFTDPEKGIVYRRGQYLESLNARHQEEDRIQEKYGFSVRKDLPLLKRRAEMSARTADLSSEEWKEYGRLHEQLGDAKEIGYMNWQRDQQGKRGFFGNLGNLLANGNWDQDKDLDQAWYTANRSRADEWWVSRGHDKSYEEMNSDGKKGFWAALNEIGNDPTKIAPFLHNISFYETEVRNAAYRVSTRNTWARDKFESGSPYAKDAYLLVARGNREKADQLYQRDMKILEGYRKRLDEDVIRGKTIMYDATNTLVGMLPYGLELAATAPLTGPVSTGIAKGTTGALAKMAPNVVKAAKAYRWIKPAAEIAGGTVVNTPNIVNMAAGLSAGEWNRQAVKQDEAGNWHVDTTGIDGAAIDRNAFIQSTAEIASEFSGALLGKAMRATKLGRLEQWLSRKYIPSGMRKIAKKIRFNGTLEEVGEEWINNLAVYSAAAENLGAESPDDFATRMEKFVRDSWDQTPSMLLSFAVLPAMGMAVKFAGTMRERQQREANLRQVTDALKEAGEKREEIGNRKYEIGNAPAAEDAEAVMPGTDGTDGQSGQGGLGGPNSAETTVDDPMGQPGAGSELYHNSLTGISGQKYIELYRKRFGNVISTDNVKLLNPNYNPHDEKSVVAMHKSAARTTRDLFNVALDNLREGDTVIFTGGGNGSGKSSVLAAVGQDAAFVMDSTMVNLDATRKGIQAVLDRGGKPVLAFAYRSPAEAWFNGVLKRNESKDGHIVPKNTFANTHANARKNFIQLAEEFGDRVEIHILEDGSREITLDELKRKPDYTKEQILEVINGVQSGTIQKGNNPAGEGTDSAIPAGTAGERNTEIQRADNSANRDFAGNSAGAEREEASRTVSRNGAVRTVKTPDGSMKVQARFKIINLPDVIHSGKEGYDQSLQPRNRDTKSSEAQIIKIGKELDPELLLDSPVTDMGAPIVDSRNQVISGNGRVMGIIKAGSPGGKGLKAYFDRVRKFAAENGIEIPPGVDRPLLVREVGDGDLVKLAELSNRDNKLRRSDAEQAEADAKTILENNLLDLFDPGEDGTINTASNSEFLGRFITAAGDESMRNSDGSVSDSAEKRVQRALLAALFADQKDGRELIRNLVENAGEDGLKTKINGVIAAAGQLMKQTRRKGYEQYDLTNDLAAAFRNLLTFKRENKASGGKRYRSIEDYLDQGDMFKSEERQVVEMLTRYLANATSSKQIREDLQKYAEKVKRIDVHTESMFGFEDERKIQILQALGMGSGGTDKTDKTDKTARQASGADAAKKPAGEHYFKGTFKEFFAKVKNLPQGVASKYVFGPVSKKIRDFLKSNGIDLKVPYKHIIDNSAIHHILNYHSSEREILRGQVPITEEDIANIPDVVENYDHIGTKEEKNQKRIVYAKEYPDGTTLFMEEVRTGKKELAAVTLYKMKGGIPNDLLPIFNRSRSSNARSDSAIPPTAGNIKQGGQDVKQAERKNEEKTGPDEERAEIEYFNEEMKQSGQFDKDNVPVLKLAPRTAEQDRIRKLMKEVFNRDITFYVSDNLNAPDGFHSQVHGDKLYLNARKNYLLQVALHEFFHSISGTEDGKRIMQIILDHRGKDAYEKWKEQYQRNLDANHVKRYSEDLLLEEFCADTLGMLSGRESFWKELAKKEPSILQKFLDFLREMRKKIEKVVGSPQFDRVKPVIAKLEQTEKQIAAVLRGERKEAAGQSASSGQSGLSGQSGQSAETRDGAKEQGAAEGKTAGRELTDETDPASQGYAVASRTDKTDERGRRGAGREAKGETREAKGTEQKNTGAAATAEEKYRAAKTYAAQMRVLTELPDGVHVINGWRFEKTGNVFDYEGNKLAARDLAIVLRSGGNAKAQAELEQAARTQQGNANSGRSGQSGQRGQSAEDEADAGRFNQESETPLLSDEEDAGDFQLFAETPQEAQKRDQAADKAEADKMERAKEEARRNAPELPFAENEEKGERNGRDAGADAEAKKKEDVLKQSDDPEIYNMALYRQARNQAEVLDALKSISGKDIVNRESGIPAQINSEQRNKLVSSKSREKSNRNGFSNEDHFHAVANIDHLYENASMVDSRPDKDNNPDVISIKRFVAPVLLNGEFAEAYITVKETRGNKVYSMELDELKKPSDIQGGTLPKDRYHIPEGYRNLLRKVEKAREILKKTSKKTENPKFGAGNTKGKALDVYRRLVELDKQAKDGDTDRKQQLRDQGLALLDSIPTESIKAEAAEHAKKGHALSEAYHEALQRSEQSPDDKNLKKASSDAAENLNQWAEEDSMFNRLLRMKGNRGIIVAGEYVPFTDGTDKTDAADEQVSAKDSSKGSRNAVQKPGGPTQKIEDFGEKIGGARKDLIRTYADKINLKGETFAKMFPKPDYPKLIEAGIKLDALAKLKNAYDSAKHDVKRHKTMSGRQDLRVAQFYAAYAKAALMGEESPDFAAAGYKFTEYGKWHIPFKSRVIEDLFKRLGTEYAGIDLGNFYFEDTWVNGKKPEKQDSGYVSANQEDLDKRYRVSSIWGRTGFFDSYDEAFDYYIEQVKAHTTLDKPKYEMAVYKQLAGEHRGEYFIAAKIRGFGAVPLQYFKSWKEVQEYKDRHADDLQHQAEMMEEQKKAERKGKNNGKGGIRLKFNAETLRDRVGTDYRNGKDVTVQEFAERFGFRGVEFGNYVTQKERQAALNATYDSLLDLASALEVSPRALSLGGRLGFAYGARGSGGAGAHFEPQKNVINLTKTRGAGALAHEWWHALDYYLSGSEEKSATDGVYKDGTREELKKVFEELRKVFLSGKSDYRERAQLLDASAGKEYYSTPTELGARAFSDYVTRQLEAKGQINDFLSSHVSEKDWAGGAETYPYPTGEDAVKIDGALQGLFNTIEEKTDPNGHSMLFSFGGDHVIPEEKDFDAALETVLDAGAKESRYVFKTPHDRKAILDGAKRFFKEFAHKEIYLSDGRKVYFMPDHRAFSRGDAAAWAEYCIHSVTSSGKTIPGKDFAERIFNHHKLENMDRIEPIIKEENVFGQFNDKDPAKDAVIFIGQTHDGKRMEIITRLDQYGNINADLTEVTVLVTRSKKENPPSRPLTEVVEAVAQHQAAGFSPSTGNNLPGDPAKVKPEIEEIDEKSEPDIKLSISGEIGMENLSRESQEGLRRLENLQTAKRMHKFGGKMDVIKFQTGWELGKDGKWRTELPDVKVKRKGVLPDGIEYEKSGSDFYFNGKLGDYIDAPEIFKAYPELRNLPLDVSPASDGESGGVYYRKSFDLATGNMTGGNIKLEIANPSADLIEDILVHEVQHAIQDIEGFARGGTPEEFESKTDKLRPLVNAYVKKGNASKKFRRYRKLELDFDKVFEGDDADYEAWMEKHGKELEELSRDPEVRALLDERADVAKRFGNSLAVLRVMKYPNDPKAWKAVAVDDESFKEAQYRRLAGEVEARNAQRRSKMPLEKRLRKLLSATEDVAEEDKIYLEKAVGEALSKASDDVKMSVPEAGDISGADAAEGMSDERGERKEGDEEKINHYSGKIIHVGDVVIPVAQNIDIQNETDVRQFVEELMKTHIGERYAISSDGNKVEIGKKLPNEYSRSDYSEGIRRSKPEIWNAKVQTVNILGGLIEFADNRGIPEKPKHGIHREGGVYVKYRTRFAVESGSNTDVYIGKLLIYEAANGKNYLYDLIDIKKDTVYTRRAINARTEYWQYGSNIDDNPAEVKSDSKENPEKIDGPVGPDGQNGQNGSTSAEATADKQDERNGTEGTEKPGMKFSAPEAGTDKKSYYQIPFAEGLKRVVDPAAKAEREPVFVSETPEIFRKIGFTALPMMMNVRHLRLNYYTPQEFRSKFGTMREGEHAHGLHTYLSGLPNALKYPLAVVANLTPNAKPGSVVAITNMNVAGNKVVVPVLIEATSQADNKDIDAHLVLTVYDSDDWREKFLRPAMDAEKNGIGVFYFDPKKVGQYRAYSNRIGTIPSGILHNINDEGSPVKGNFKKQTETLQFKRWFGDSKVVDENGEPLVVYHGTRGNSLSSILQNPDQILILELWGQVFTLRPTVKMQKTLPGTIPPKTVNRK